ncbi:hydroxyisourate hydrolase [Snodgrassella sp. CFCC 13594]|uniref:hydroxyisourate hydrolase n=1 Tax=Snodgrassella sp. CFCC 13594 TaxID=1775559 RepID=UPI0008315444|nr:hydroxyisourate hydrolase [Snodgrassella sp. CFCC 13594]
MSPITTHILDTVSGLPAAHVRVQLYDGNQLLDERHTDDDGRIKNFHLDAISAGTYRLVFDVAPYFAKQKQSAFFPQVCLDFVIEDTSRHYHVPLLLSPFAYSTYRGS